MKAAIDVYDIQILGTITNKKYRINVFSRTRNRKAVFGRMIMYRIFRDLGYSLKQIAKVFDKDHSTIINALNNFSNYSSYDEEMIDSYNQIKDEFFVTAKINERMADEKKKEEDERTKKMEALAQENKKLSLQLSNLTGKLSTYKTLIDLLEERQLNKNEVDYVTRRINQILNGSHSFVE